MNYKLYAISVVDITQDTLKGFEYSLRANNHYALIYTDRVLSAPYKPIQDGISLAKNEIQWLAECKLKINVRAMQEHEREYADLISEFCEQFDLELKVEQDKLKIKEGNGGTNNA